MRKVCYESFIYILIISAGIFLFSTIALASSPVPKIEQPIDKPIGQPIDKTAKMREKETDTMRLVYEKMVKRTKECKDSLDSLFFTLVSLTDKAKKEGEIEREKELIAISRDYNGFLGDLGAMQIVLDLGELIEDEKFIEYFELMATAFEHLKSGFSLNNEVFLKRIGELKDQEALGYEKKLLSLFREYFVYDPWREKVEDTKDEAGKDE